LGIEKKDAISGEAADGKKIWGDQTLNKINK